MILYSIFAFYKPSKTGVSVLIKLAASVASGGAEP
jgi:hypothetical protein